jgi:hypothetical protein
MKDQAAKLGGLSIIAHNKLIVPHVLIETQILNQAMRCHKFLRHRTIPTPGAATALEATETVCLRLCSNICRARREVGVPSVERRARGTTTLAVDSVVSEHEVSRMYEKLKCVDEG